MVYSMKPRAKRIAMPIEVRQYVFERDHFCCQSCGKTEGLAQLEIDHIIALSAGGSNDISNLQTLCRSCNQKKKQHRDRRFQQHFRN